MRKPSNNPITLPFGSTEPPYNASNKHKGTDFSYIPDNKIYAPFAGLVTQVPNNGNDGNGTYMTDPQGRYHGLLHASKYLVPNGTKVKEGQAVAVMGETGLAQGIHLHWAVKQNGVFIDPMSIIGEEEDMPTPGNVNTLIRSSLDRPPTDAELNKFSKLPWERLVAYIAETAPARQKEDAKKLADCYASGGGEFEPVTDPLFKRKPV